MSDERFPEYVPSPMWGSYVTTDSASPATIGRYTDAERPGAAPAGQR